MCCVSVLCVPLVLTVSGVVVAQDAQVEQVLEKYYFPAKTTLEVLLRNKGFAMEEFMKNTLPRVKTGKVWTLCVLSFACSD